MHAYEMRACEMHAYEIHARRPYGMQACEMQGENAFSFLPVKLPGKMRRGPAG